ncbi:hypothetical protein QJQ45_016102 [Haematococcus lacustris]|nr:hypothetical protein QJQ45_016102 [Haematococcus lacustris]
MPPKRNRKRPVSPAPSVAGASGSGQQVQGQGQAAKVVIAERRQVIKAGLRGLVKAALPDFSPAQVDAIVAEINKRMTMLPNSTPPAQQLPQPTEDPLWEEYLKPCWRRQRLGLHHAQDRVIEGFCKKVVEGMKWVSRQHYHEERGVAVFLGAGNFSQGGWKAGAVWAGFRKVVEQPSRPSTDPRPGRLVIVDEFRTTRRPLELCRWDDVEALPPIGKEYQQGYKRLNDRLPKSKFAATHTRAGMYLAMRQACKRAIEYGVPQEPCTLCHLIGAFVLPLGLYGSQVWGTAFLGHGVQLSNPLQTRKLSFLRFDARVRSSVSGLMVLHELGQLNRQGSGAGSTPA